ncbi:hypothetical protein BV898_02059 [Hypsibius exemplaris]|uniref:Transmembrane protein 126A n=1 Tax=Hypsibius exemplaris TaxID=2072580 RepID=A0A1W0X995_HYPEX|nr:hypothetical protein BV898_02059 [Hypsibius exemplaris]
MATSSQSSQSVRRYDKYLASQRKGPTYEELLDRRRAIVEKWQPEHDMYPLLYGPFALGMLSSLTALPILTHYRSFLKLRTKGAIISTVALLMLPAGCVAGMQISLVVEPLLSKPIMCPVCYEVRSAALQLAAGVAWPMVSCSSLSLFLAISHKTEAVPSLGHFAEAFAFYRKMNRNLGKWVAGGAVASMVASVGMVLLQFRSMEMVWARERETRLVEAEPRRSFG